ncbi:putative membrane protein [Bacillus phage SP-15]|uniref:Putative membrane protein n=1 Tax=Bacillus phage SP-15 TaxID=1792032 RepID=A0A127AXU7_9CAUD|nr:hypothetical protein SP15_231A [Bacillus phage SP-15]AMM45034.1 putative membrane protein [Bacillus phage SP-15]
MPLTILSNLILIHLMLITILIMPISLMPTTLVHFRSILNRVRSTTLIILIIMS